MDTSLDFKRYSRQMFLPEIGLEGQQALKKCRVLCVGLGGLGSPSVAYLAAAGVGKIGLMDPDLVDETNLQRQILFGSSTLRYLKTDAVRDRLIDLNPHVTLEVFSYALNTQNAENLFRQFDLVVDGTDNFEAKFLINDAAAKVEIPMVYGALSGFEGQVSVFWKGHGPCYRCLFPHPPLGKIQNCAEAGVLGPVAGLIASIQAIEVIKLILYKSELGKAFQPLLGRILWVDARTWELNEFKLKSRPSCPICSFPSESISLTALGATEAVCAPQINDLELLKPEDIPSFQLIDVRESHEWKLGNIPGSLNWPLSQLIKGEFPTLESGTREVLLYCQTGKRSAKALEILQSTGVLRVKHLRGGFVAWQENQPKVELG